MVKVVRPLSCKGSRDDRFLTLHVSIMVLISSPSQLVEVVDDDNNARSMRARYGGLKWSDQTLLSPLRIAG